MIIYSTNLMKLGLLNIKLKTFAYLGNGETEKALLFCKSRMEIQTAYIRGLVHLAVLAPGSRCKLFSFNFAHVDLTAFA